ncbi:EpsG family protein [Enterobacter hormaechei]|uniref:EpsG family protein n=1 Tax=Enterobacter hormaechei TaxID=158836 RepID=UPI0029652B0D|nr:EpsG family protein [Enterobacter hormaechei]MDW2866439.1 EpsG family protein [Enterobacter hormaechei]
MIFLALNFFLFLLSFRNDKVIFKIGFIVTAAYCSLSFGRGFDWINYYDVYQNLDLKYYDSPFEPGYYFLLRIFKLFGLSYGIHNFIVIGFLFFCIHNFCIKTKNPSLAFFTLFCFLGHYILSEQIRQALAICIILRFFDVIRNRRVVAGSVVILIAMTFHMSAVFCFLLFFIINDEKKNTNIKFLVYCVSFLFVAYILWLYPVIISSIPMLYNKFIDYTNAYTEGFISVERIISSKVVFIYFMMLIMCLLLLINNRLSSVNSSIKALIFMIITKLTIFLGRFQYYMIPLLIIGLDDYFKRSKKPWTIDINRLFYAICLFVISLVPLWTPSTYESINDSLYINASDHDIENAISRRCATLNYYDPENGAIRRCRL